MTITDLLPLLQKVKAAGSGKWTARCPAHADTNPSLSISLGRDGAILLKCFAGCTTEAIVAALGLKLADLFDKPLPAQPYKPALPPVIETVYSYQDELGTELFQVVRLKPKDFRQRRAVNGNYQWGIGDARRVLYHLPQVLSAEEVWVVEGEKDADALASIGMTATTNPHGAGKWLDAYTESLAGKDVVLCGDNDGPGKAHVRMVIESLAGKVASLRLVELPTDCKDISDWLCGHDAKQLGSLKLSAKVFDRGIVLPIQSIGEMESEYKAFLNETESRSFSFGAWLPSLNAYRAAVPGEMVVIVADTGQGKSAALQNIAECAAPNPVLFCEMELPGPVMFERFAAIANDVDQRHVETGYRMGESARIDKLRHIFCVSQAGLLPADIERLVVQSELKIGKKPLLVMVDYIGLIKGAGKRYERLSDAAEELKIVAKRTGTILIAASQVHRKADDAGEEIFLHDAKDTGSIENSAQIMLGLWRNMDDEAGKTLTVKVCKCTRGKAGTKVLCNFDGDTLRIRERYMGVDPRPTIHTEAALS